MSIIAVSGIPELWDMRRLVIMLVKCVRGHFEGLNFDQQKGPKRTAYLRLSSNLNPSRVIQNINKNKFKFAKKQFKLNSFIPTHVPELPYAIPQKVPNKTQKHFKIPLEKTPDQLALDTHNEFLIELQSKYTGLFTLSTKTNHKLLIDISTIIFERLKQLVTTSSPEIFTSGFLLSRAYRKTHPHFADFQMILSTLHRIEDEEGTPRTQLLEHELSAMSKTLSIGGNVPFDKMNSICSKYSNQITKKVKEYIGSLQSDLQPASPEDRARNRVKEEVLKMSPYIELIVHQVVTTNFVTQALKATNCIKMRIYGEPFLPSRELLTPIMTKHAAIRIRRSEFLYNMLQFNIPKNKYTSFMEYNGTVLGSSKIIVRPSEMNAFKLHISKINSMKATIRQLL